MLSTAIGIQFDVNDLSSSYEVIGSSDNYSFQYNLGKGSKLVDFAGETAQKTVSLKGNYGEFSIRVFAISDIGIRSEFIEDKISVSPPFFDETFTFSDIRIDNLPEEANVGRTIEIEPSLSGNLLAVNSEYINRDLEISWRLAPPVGHAKEGQSLGNELLSDKFLDNFSIQIRNTENGNVISTSDLNNSIALQQTLNTASVSDMMDAYTGFSFIISDNTLTELSLDRTLALEVVSNDMFGRQATGVITGLNYEPIIDTLSYNLRGAKMSFSWSAQDTDFRGVEISSLGIPGELEIYNPNSLQDSLDHYRQINDASPWDIHNNYLSGSKVLSDGKVFECIQSYSFSSAPNVTPEEPAYWKEIGEPFNFFETKDFVLEKSNIEYSQVWGYNYYYSFLPSDGYGTGTLANLTETGLVNGGELGVFRSDVKVDNLNFIEREDDLIFRWNITDQDNNLVDLNQYKFLVGSSDKPRLLGISGSLFDSDTNNFLTGITEGLNSRTSVVDNGVETIIEDLPGAKVFETYEYTREINNKLYETGGFPVYKDFSTLEKYNSGENVTVNNEALYTSTEIIEDVDLPIVSPYYEEWSPGINYIFRTGYEYSSCVQFNSALYCVTGSVDGQIIGPSSSDVLGIFDERIDYSLGDLVIAPNERVDIYHTGRDFFIGDLVLHHGSIYRCHKNQNSLDSILPSTGQSYWSTVGPFQASLSDIYKAISPVASGSQIIPSSGINHWQIQDPETSDKFYLCAEKYEFNIINWSDELNFEPGAFVVYNNDIWSGVLSSGPDEIVGAKRPTYQNSIFWETGLGGSHDFSTNHQEGDRVFSNGFVYKCLSNNPTGAPLNAVINSQTGVYSSYENSQWKPYWQLNDTYDNIVFKHIGIPESGKRSVGLELGILSPEGDILNSRQIIGNNPEPSILPQGFQVDSLSNVTNVRFNFNYAFGSREQTTKVQLYRSENPNFSILDNEGLPGSGALSFVSEILGAGDSTFGKNITSIVDSPPIPHVSGLGDQITGYYYKILPFDAFGSGDLFNVTDNQGDLERVLVYPHGYNNQNKNGYMGPVFSTTEDAIPGPVSDFGGDTAFVNYFLNWKIPEAQYDLSNNLVNTSPNDISHYEVWQSEDNYLYFGVEDEPLKEDRNLIGYRKITGDLYSVGPIPSEINDPASGITNATNVLNVSAISPAVQVTHKGTPNDKRHFWVRAVDHAGNKGPFTGKANLASEPSDNVIGLDLILGQANTTDISDFERNITQTFPNTLALVPNDPFIDNQPSTGEVKWDRHFLYNNGTGYVIGASDTVKEKSVAGVSDAKYIYWRAVDMTHSLSGSEKMELGLALPGEKVVSLVAAGIDSAQTSTRDTLYITRDPTAPPLALNGLGSTSDFDGHYAKFLNGTQNQQERKISQYTVYNAPNYAKIELARPFDSAPNPGENIQILEEVPVSFSTSNPLSNIVYSGQYRVSDYHPAGEGATNNPTGYTGPDMDATKPKLLDENDFIIARNAGGIATPMWHAFANATIGTAHIEEAAITNAKIHNLTADKIRSSIIQSQDIQIGGDSESGQIRSYDFGTATGKGFDGINYTGAGFAISGNGSFIFKGQDTPTKHGGKIFYRDGELNIHGNIRQRDGTELTVLNINAEPSTFDYSEDRHGDFIPDDPSQEINLSTHFYNSDISASDVRFRMTDPDGNSIFEYSDHDVSTFKYDRDGFLYDPADPNSFDQSNKIAKATFLAGSRLTSPQQQGFDTIIHPSANSTPNFLSVNIFVSGVGTSTEDKVTIHMLSQGAPGPTGKSPIYRGVWRDWQTRGDPSTPAVNYLGIDEQVNGAEALRGDLVYFNTTSDPAGANGDYYIAILDNGPDIAGVGAQTPSSTSSYWNKFGAQFESVATNLLLAKDAVITKSLVMGSSDDNNPEAGTNGKIISSDWASANRGFGSSYADPGYMLSVEAGTPQGKVEFDIGGPGPNAGQDYSYLRYSSSTKKIEIVGSFTNNTVIENVNISDVTATDFQATFIGGGYNNEIHEGPSNTYNSLGSSIVAGAFNDITGRFSFIGNGYNNSVADNFSAIVAGYNNSMPDVDINHAGANIIGAGSNNVVDGGSNQSIVAGKHNEIEYNPNSVSIPYTSIPAGSQYIVLNPAGFIWGMLGPSFNVAASASSVGLYWFGAGWFCSGFSIISPESKLHGAKNLRDSSEVSKTILVSGLLGTPTTSYVFIVPTYYSGESQNAWFQLYSGSSLNSTFGWLWTNEDIKPFAYSNTLGNWVYFDLTTANRYYDYASSTYKTF